MQQKQQHQPIPLVPQMQQRSEMQQMQQMQSMQYLQQCPVVRREEPGLGGIQEVIGKQHFEGSWGTPLMDFELIVWEAIPEITGVVDESERKQIQQMVFALAMLEKSGDDKRILWSLIREKAIEWLESRSASINWDGIISRVQGLVP
jgi:hypothetical protein